MHGKRFNTGARVFPRSGDLRGENPGFTSLERKEKMTIATFLAAFIKILSTPSLIGKLFLLLTKLLASIAH